MKFVASSVLIALLSFASCLYLPWWSIALIAFIVSILINQRPWLSFLAGFLALFILWSFMAFYISSKNENVLAHKMAMIILKTDSPVGLVLFTGVIGALVAGCAALAGSFLRMSDLLSKRQKYPSSSDGSKPIDSVT